MTIIIVHVQHGGRLPPEELLDLPVLAHAPPHHLAHERETFNSIYILCIYMYIYVYIYVYIYIYTYIYMTISTSWYNIV